MTDVGKAGSVADKAAAATEKATSPVTSGVEKAASEVGGLLGGTLGRLNGEVRNLVGAIGDSALSGLKTKVAGAAQRLADYAENGGGPGLAAAVTGGRKLAEGESVGRSVLGAGMAAVKDTVGGLVKGGGNHGGKGKKLKVTNIVESIDVGAPVRLTYDQWTQFQDFPSFMKKVESVEQESDEKLNWKAQVFWSHRTWESSIVKQVPDEEIVWRSKGPKGYVDGAVTFHELAPRLTRVQVVLEYHPQGFFEHTGNIWRAQGRRARLELKHFERHVMTQVLLHPEEIEGWRGVIEDGQVVMDHETAMAEEAEEADRREGASSDAGADVEQEDQYEASDEEPEGEYEQDEEEEEGEYEEEDGHGRDEGDEPQARGGRDGGEAAEERPRRVVRRTREGVGR